MRNEDLNFYFPFEKLKDYEKTHFLPEQNISIKKVLEVDEMENITRELKHYYIFDGIEQMVMEEIERWLDDRKHDRIGSRSLSPRASHKVSE